MAINSIGSGGFNPYTTGVARPGTSAARPMAPQTRTDVAVADPKSLANAIKSDAAARTAQLNSPNAPAGVDQDLWSVLSKEERSFFMKAGTMGPLTYGRSSSSQSAAPAPILRGGRLDIKA
ncbi:MAG: hypothetical protein M3R65_03110 [Gemmatimonadota bacterium]|nr:hypothetical protein [Gemmatimonadota bacterium]